MGFIAGTRVPSVAQKVSFFISIKYGEKGVVCVYVCVCVEKDEGVADQMASWERKLPNAPSNRLQAQVPGTRHPN